MSFVLGAVSHQGYAFLDTPGMKLERRATYTFGGIGDVGRPARASDVVGGPHDRSYVQTDDVVAGRWSACSAISNLVINTHLMLTNDLQRTGTGYVNSAAVDGALQMAFPVRWRRCQ